MNRDAFMEYLSVQAQKAAEEYYAGKISEYLPDLLLKYLENMLVNPSVGSTPEEMRILVKNLFHDVMYDNGRFI